MNNKIYIYQNALMPNNLAKIYISSFIFTICKQQAASYKLLALNYSQPKQSDKIPKL